MYNLTQDKQSVLKDGNTFFTSPIANDCMASLEVGVVMPDAKAFVKEGYEEPYWGSATTEIVVAGGNCCYGHVMGVNEKGKVTAILAVDLNVRCIVPIIYDIDIVHGKDMDKQSKKKSLGLLVSGVGCSGSGIRFVDFSRPTPTQVPVLMDGWSCTGHHASDYKRYASTIVVPHRNWHKGINPLTVPDIWDRIAGIGINVDRELTDEAVKLFSTFQ